MASQKFHSSWGLSVWMMSILGTLLLLSLSVYLLVTSYTALSANPIVSAINLIAAIFCIFILIIAALFAPRYYTINQDNITVHRLGPNIHIPWSNECLIKKIESSDIKNMMRIFACGGLFGFMGIFRSRNFGYYRVYANNFKHPCFITTATHKFLLCPDNRDDFINAVTANQPSP